MAAQMSFTVDIDVQVPMRDGTRLATNIWRPQADGPAPALLVRLPYGKDIMMEQFTYTAPVIYSVMEAGYVVAIQDCRGTFRSEGDTFTPHVTEADDGADTVRWLCDQPWCDGNIGMYGASYLGFVQWQAAVTGVPGLKAMAPAVTSADLYRAPWYSPGGALSLDTILAWTTLMAMNGLQRQLSSGRQLPAGRSDPRDLMALAGSVASPDALMAATPVAEQALLARYMPWLTELLAHPAADEFWQQYASVDRAAAITVPALNIGGWYDLFCNETLRAYTTMRRHGGSPAARDGQRLIIGPWSHTNQTGMFPDRTFGIGGGIQAAQLTTFYLPFFDRWLRGREDALDGLAPVRIFVMGVDRWRDEQDWPLPDTSYTDYFLDGAGRANAAGGDGALSVTVPAADAQETFLYDPRRPVPTLGGVSLSLTDFNGPADQRAAEARDDVLCFGTGVLDAPVEVTGPVSLTLHVSSSAVDTDFTGKLVDVHPDGRAIILCEGIQRMRYRKSLAEPELMSPGDIYEITLDLSATANVFLPGHRIRLEVSSSNFPRYDRNSNTGGVIAQEREDQMITAVNHVRHGPGHPSRLTLPIISR